MPLQSRCSKRILAVLAAAVCAMMFYFVLICERDLRQTGSTSQALYSKRVVGLGLQGDLQYATQESRRTFLYVLTTSDKQTQLEYVAGVRRADLSVSLLAGKTAVLRMGPEELERFGSLAHLRVLLTPWSAGGRPQSKPGAERPRRETAASNFILTPNVKRCRTNWNLSGRGPNMRKSFVLASTFVLLLTTSLSAQNAQENQRFTFGLGAGFTTPVGNTGRFLDDGWNIQGGAGFNFSPYFGVMIDLNYNSMGVNSATLSNLGFPGGGVHIFSATLDPIVHLNPHGRFDVYLTGGGGIYHDNENFTAPGVATVTVFDGFFGAFPVGVPVTNVLSSYTVNKPGVDVGAGIALGSKWHGRFFAEARYNRIFMGQFHTDYVPVTFGFRW